MRALLMQGACLQIVYKRYASLYFVAGIEEGDNELITLEVIHHFVEVLDRYFGNVCELDLIFNFHKVRGGECAHPCTVSDIMQCLGNLQTYSRPICHSSAHHVWFMLVNLGSAVL